MKRTAVGLAALLTLGATGPVPRCIAGPDQLCGFDRPEDVAPLPGGRWLAVSAADGLRLIDPASDRRIAIAADGEGAGLGDPACPGAPAALHPRGIDVRALAGGARLAAINQADGTRIELFAVRWSGGRPAARWQGCVAVPATLALNDVALAPDGSLYASNMFDPAPSQAAMADRRERFLARRPTGRVVHWTPRDGWRPVAGSDLSLANGVAVSHDGRTLAAAGTFDQALLLIDRVSGAVTRVALPLQPDNIVADREGFLVAGHTGVPVTGVDPCRDPKAVPCGFPFAVARVASGRATPVYSHDGGRFPGASVAAPWRGRLALGSAYGDRITLVARR